VLFEKSDKLGGLLNDINKLPFKDDMLRYTEWLQRETLSCGADIRLGTEATAATVMAENPDAILVAVGSVPLTPKIEGLTRENVYNVLDVDSGRKQIPSGSKVVVCGGGLSGCESALALAMDGCKVTVVDMIETEDFAKGTHDLTRKALMHLLEKNGVQLIGGNLVRKIDDKGVLVENREWKFTVLEADYIVEAFGQKKNPAYEQFKELIPDVYYIGDCAEVKNILHANFTAYDRSLNI